jgi:hypothetical protein
MAEQQVGWRRVYRRQRGVKKLASASKANWRYACIFCCNRVLCAVACAALGCAAQCARGVASATAAAASTGIEMGSVNGNGRKTSENWAGRRRQRHGVNQRHGIDRPWRLAKKTA